MPGDASLFIATPMYGGSACAGYVRSLFELARLAAREGVALRDPCFPTRFSLVTAARNFCAAEFLAAGADHLMFIDADVEFVAADVLELMRLNGDGRDVVAGVYPRKEVFWEDLEKGLANSLAAGNRRPGAEALRGMATRYLVGGIAPGTYGKRDLMPVSEAATGFMMIRRDALQRFAAAYPDLAYRADDDGKGESTAMRTAFFLDGIDEGRHVTEDFLFCRRARRIGLSVWIAPWMRLVHHGTHGFAGDFRAALLAGRSSNS